MTIHPIILCGGGGTRLWPKSRGSQTKPFIDLVGDTSLFEQALARTGGRARFAPPLVVAGAAHVGAVEAQMPDPDARVIVEPMGRNTAPAIALAALRLPADAVMLVCPSDHHIGDTAAFVDAAGRGAALARDGWLVSLGIAARAAETGYGYLRQGEPLAGGGFRTAQFVEKPDAGRAAAFLAEGGYWWNGGIFLFTAGRFLEELGAHRPAMLDRVSAAVAEGRGEGRLFHPAPAPFAEVAGESIDYAVMERTARAALVPVEMGWSDVGNWASLFAVQARDAAGNATRGDVRLDGCRATMVDAGSMRVTAIGLDSVVIVVDGNDVMVSRLDQSTRVAAFAALDPPAR